MNDDRLERAEAETPELAREGDDGAEDADAEIPSDAVPGGNVVRTTSPFAPADVREGVTFEQRDPAVVRARDEGERLIR